ncbi:hypothetical protein [Candidatus Avelusimicrobium fimicolum]|uniref:hypothetical protein n=1 Tax=Candidatus Avelusimicrobium fimicolum TaxID=3416216 RepID=UPI003D0E65C5
MEQVIMYVVNAVIGLADKYPAVSYTLMAIGGLYVLLSALRGFLTAIVKLTKTDKDDKIISTIFAFLDKYAYGFGKLGEYFEAKTKDNKKGK